MSDNPMELPKEGWKPSSAQPDPTTWVSRPVCATDAMIEAGASALAAFLDRPPPDIARQLSSEDGINSAVYNRRKVEIILAAALKASPRPPAVRPWLPIESAPNAEVLLYFPPKPMGRHNQMMQGAMYRIGRADEYPRRPTHWQPLPEPPATGDADHG